MRKIATVSKLASFVTEPSSPYSGHTHEELFTRFLHTPVLSSLLSGPSFFVLLSLYLYSTDQTISLYTHPRSVPGHFQGPVVLR
jgi:hypothetical protein